MRSKHKFFPIWRFTPLRATLASIHTMWKTHGGTSCTCRFQNGPYSLSAYHTKAPTYLYFHNKCTFQISSILVCWYSNGLVCQYGDILIQMIEISIDLYTTILYNSPCWWVGGKTQHATSLFVIQPTSDVREVLTCLACGTTNAHTKISRCRGFSKAQPLWYPIMAICWCDSSTYHLILPHPIITWHVFDVDVFFDT